MKKFLLLAVANFVLGLCLASTTYAASTLVGINTDGTIYEINVATGALTQKAQESTSNFSLGAIVRTEKIVYYVAAPSGTSESSIFKATLKSGTISHVDLDKSDADDEVTALFLKGSKLYGIFKNSNAGTAGVYKINPKTGKTSLVVDLASLDAEPVGGAIARKGDFYYSIVTPYNATTTRQLIRFRLKANSTKAVDIKTKEGTSVVCDRIKFTKDHKDLACLATSSSTQVDFCKISEKGKARCLATLANVERIAGGHTMMTPDGKSFYAFVYAPGDSNSQRLVKISAKGAIKATATISTLIIGARFGKENDDQS